MAAPETYTDNPPEVETPDSSSEGGSATSPAWITAQSDQAQEQSKPAPRLNVERATKLYNYFTENPQWFGNPNTKHVAADIFHAAGDVLSKNMEMERLGNATLATKNRNSFLKQKLTDLSKASPFVPATDADGQAEMGRLNAMASNSQSQDFNLEEFASGVARLQSKYHAPTTLDAAKERHKAELDSIEQRFQNQLALIDPKNQAAIDLLRERHRLALELFTEELPQKTEAAKELIGARVSAHKDAFDKAMAEGDVESAKYYGDLMKKDVHIATGKQPTAYDLAPPEVKATLKNLMVQWQNAALGGVTKDGTPVPPDPAREQKLANTIKVFREKYGLETKPTPSAATNAPASAAETQTGQIYKGYKFLGGDKADKNNWQPVQP